MENYVLVDLANRESEYDFLTFCDRELALKAKRSRGGRVFRVRQRKRLGHMRAMDVECPTCRTELTVWVGDKVSIMIDIHASPDGQQISFKCGHLTSPREAVELMKSRGFENPHLTLCHPRQVRRRWGLRSPVFGWWKSQTVTAWGDTVGVVICSAEEVK